MMGSTSNSGPSDKQGNEKLQEDAMTEFLKTVSKDEESH